MNPADLLMAGIAHRRAGRLTEAAGLCRQILRLQPDHPDALHLLGVVAREQGQSDMAVTLIGRAIALNGGVSDYHSDLGSALQDLGRLDEAIDRHRAAVAIAPDSAGALYNLAVALEDRGDRDDAAAHYRRALALDPDLVEARMRLVMARLPILYDSPGDVDRRRADYAAGLDALAAWLDGPAAESARAARVIGTAQPCLLACQGRNDRDLQSRYGRMIAELLRRADPMSAAPPPATAPAPGEPIRVGIVSGFFRDHAVWKLPVAGWAARLDRSRVRLFGYHTAAQRDAETARAQALFDRFVQGPLSAEDWCTLIRGDGLHVLIYPEIGQDPMVPRLAGRRLAPVQCTTLGHPETSGLPTIDYFLGSDLMEPADAARHYTETLVRLPNLALYCEPPPLSSGRISRDGFGIDDGDVVYWCCQSLFKYLPDHDAVFPRIAERVEGSRFLFIAHDRSGTVTARFQNRLSRAFAARGLDADVHCRLLPKPAPDRFVATAALCDAGLDSIGWSGCNSTLESLSVDLPIVTLPGALMRGRHTMAILRRMEVAETIADSLDDYVEIAVRLGRDPAWRATLRRRIAERKHRLWRDEACIRALEDFLETAVRTASAPSGRIR